MERRIFQCTSAEYEIELLSDLEIRKEEIIALLLNEFIADETLMKSLKLNANLTELEMEDFKMDEKLLMSTALDGATVLIALHKQTNRISGVLVIVIRDREKMEKEAEEQKKVNNGKELKRYEGQLKSRVTEQFFEYVAEMDKQGVDVFDVYPDCKVYADFEIIGVNRLDRKKGLGLDLYKAALTVLKEIPEVDILSGTYTSSYSKKIAEKIGKTVISNVDISQFRDKLGNPVFQDTKPHNIVSIMAMRI